MPCAVAHQAPMMDELDGWQLPRCIQCAEDETRMWFLDWPVHRGGKRQLGAM